jgi:hypothetical protein
MNTLPDDLVRNILGWVPPGEVIQSVALVSTRFARLVREESFWWNHPLVLEHADPRRDLTVDEDEDKYEARDLKRSRIQNYSSINSSRDRRQQSQKQQQQQLYLLPRTLSMSQLQRFCLYATAVQQKMDIPTCLRMGSVLVSKEQASESMMINFCSSGLPLPPLPRPRQHHRAVCAASTTDSVYLNEALENVLPSSQEQWNIQRRLRQQRISHSDSSESATTAWWSSAPSPNPDSEDTLLFTLQGSTTMITAIQLKPLVDPFHSTNKVYTWKKTILRAYYIPPIEGSFDNYDYDDYAQEVMDNKQITTTTTTGEIPLVAHCCQTRQYNQEEDNGEDFEDSDDDHEHHDPKPSAAKASVFYSFCPTGMRLPLRRMGTPLLFGGVRGAWHLLPPPTLPSDQATIDGVLANHVPVYESQTYDNTALAESNQVLHYSIPLGVIANVIVITLCGKNHEAFAGTGYYACVEKVDCYGIEL